MDNTHFKIEGKLDIFLTTACIRPEIVINVASNIFRYVENEMWLSDFRNISDNISFIIENNV
jgi:hypothetical protein